MKDVLTYKEFIGVIHFSSKDDMFYGKIEGINDLVTFEGNSVSELKNSFKEPVDDYIELCQKAKKEPIKSFKGTFNVRLTPELHKKAFKLATTEGISLNQFVQKAIEHEVGQHLKL
ncbi:MAG TPA: type II toxin-antitoxin system HicB family antitoxin [Candidatus Wallbacteria bacterium]|nr:type II toxin-antitoxin system HicB family antitoxin [Candidatus Wallbacteria bacterium]